MLRIHFWLNILIELCFAQLCWEWMCQQAAEVCFLCRIAETKTNIQDFIWFNNWWQHCGWKWRWNWGKNKPKMCFCEVYNFVKTILVIIRQTVLSTNPSVITVWHLLEESLVYSCLTPKCSFFLPECLFLGPMPLKFFFSPALGFHICTLWPFSFTVASLHGLMLAGRRCLIWQYQKRKHSVLQLKCI